MAASNFKAAHSSLHCRWLHIHAHLSFHPKEQDNMLDCLFSDSGGFKWANWNFILDVSWKIWGMRMYVFRNISLDCLTKSIENLARFYTTLSTKTNACCVEIVLTIPIYAFDNKSHATHTKATKSFHQLFCLFLVLLGLFITFFYSFVTLGVHDSQIVAAWRMTSRTSTLQQLLCK